MSTEKQLYTAVIAWLSVISSVIIKFLGGWDGTLKLLVIMSGADFVTGIIVACIFKKSPKTKTGKLSSDAMFKGLVRKICIFILVGICNTIDNTIHTDIMRNCCALFFTANEGLSLLENFGKMGVKYPEFLKNVLEAMNEEGNNAGYKG